MSVWKRNAVVVAIVLFVGAAVYLNWSYNRQQQTAEDPAASETGKVLGQAGLVNGAGASAAPTATSAAGAMGSAAPSARPSGGNTGDNAQTPAQTTGYFAAARLNRQQARDSALQLLQQAAADENAAQEVIDDANTSIQAMATYTMSEANVENMVTAKGYGDCVCFINEDSASVVVSSTEDGLAEADIAKILEIVKQETGLSAETIRIIETEP